MANREGCVVPSLESISDAPEAFRLGGLRLERQVQLGTPARVSGGEDIVAFVALVGHVEFLRVDAQEEILASRVARVRLIERAEVCREAGGEAAADACRGVGQRGVEKRILKFPKSGRSGITRCAMIFEDGRLLVGLFHEYLLRGGFPQSAIVESIHLAQKLLREDIVDKVLKRDMTALFGVRRVLELEQVFLYLCLHDGGLLNLAELCSSLQLKRPTVGSFIELLESTHLIHRLLPFGYGKQVLRARAKIYLADAAIAPGVLLKGKALLEDPDALGRAVETAFFKHVFTRY